MGFVFHPARKKHLRMKKLFSIISLSILFTSCANDASLKKDIIGKWECYQTIADDGEDLQTKLDHHPIMEFSATHLTSKDYIGELPAEYHISGGKLYIKGEKGFKKIKINGDLMTWDESSFQSSIHYKFKRIQ
jgi:hypothetical protein